MIEQIPMSPPKISKTFAESFISFDIKAAAIIFPILVAAGLWYHSQIFVSKDEYRRDRQELREDVKDIQTDIKKLLTK